MQSLRLLALFGLLAAALAARAVSLTDDFSVAQTGVTRTTTGSSTSTATELATGLNRFLILTQNSNTLPGVLSSDVFVSGGAFNFDQGPAVQGNYAIDYAYSTPVSFVGLTGFQVDFRTNDQPYSLYVDLTDSAGRVSELSGSARTGFGTANLTGLSGNADLSRIVRVSLQSETNAAGIDSSIVGFRSVQPVPEPSALAALSLGALGLLRRRKRA